MSANNMGNDIDNSRNQDNTKISKEEIAGIKYDKMLEALNGMEKGSSDYLKASKIFSEIEKGNIPLESRPFSPKTEFTKEFPEFKFTKEEVDAISSFSIKSDSFLLGKDFGNFMGASTTTPHYIYDKDDNGKTVKDENNKAVKTDFKNDLKEYFTSDDYNKIDKIYVNQDFSRSYMYEKGDINISRVINDNHTDSNISKEDYNNVFIKDYKNLQLTTFEIHKTDGEIEFKSYFTNSAGDILAAYDTGDEKFPMLLAENGKCEALDTAKDNMVYRNSNNDTEIKLSKDDIEIPYDLLKNESLIAMGKSSDLQIEKISNQNSNFNSEEIIGKITNQIDLAKSSMDSLYVEKNTSMGKISETYKEVDNIARKIAGNINQMFRLDRSSETYISLKEKTNELKEDYKKAAVEFGKIYSKTDLFNDNEIKEIRAYIGEKESNIDIIKERFEILNNLPDGDREKFNVIINKELPQTTNIHTISNETSENIRHGFEKVEKAVDEWNSRNPDSPISIDYDNLALYDKHGIEIHISNEGFEKKYNEEFVKEGATIPKDENGEVTKESIEAFSDNEKYKEFTKQFDTEYVNAEEIEIFFDSNDPVDLIRHYTEEKALSEDYNDLNKDIKDEIGVKNNGKVDDSSIGDSLSNEKNNRTNIKSSFTRIDYSGTIKLSDEKLESIKAECRAELKGYNTNTDAYDNAYKNLYAKKVTEAEANLSRIVEKIKNSDTDISKMRNYLGNYFSRTNLTLSAEIIGVDSKIAAYEKAGGYIGADSFIKDKPSFVEKFGNVVSFLNGNIFLTIMTNVIYVVADSVEKNKENKVENDKNDTATKDDNKGQNDITNDLDINNSIDNNTANDDLENEEPNDTADNLENEEPDDTADDLENEEPDDTADDLENEEPNDTANDDLENEEPDDTADDLETEESDDTADDLENEEPDDTADDLENEEPDDTADDLENEEPDDTADDLENEEPDDTADDLENEEPDDTADDLKNEEPDDTADDLENEEPNDTADDLENEEPNDTADDLENEEPDDTANDDLENKEPNDTADDLETEESEETADDSEYDASSDEKNDDAAFIEDSQEQIEEDDDGDEGDDTSSDENNKDDSIADKVKDKMKEIVSDFLKGFSDFKEVHFDLFEFFDSLPNPLESIVDIVSGIVEAISNFINDKDVTNIDGDIISIQEKLSSVAEAVVDISDVCSDVMENPADEIRGSIIDGLYGKTPEGVPQNIEIQADEIKANEMNNNVDSQSYDNTDFNDYKDLSSDVDLRGIENQVEKNPLGIDNAELKAEIDVSNQIYDLSNEYIEQGLDYEDAYNTAENDLAPADDIDVNQNINTNEDYNFNDFNEDNYDDFSSDTGYEKQYNTEVPQTDDIGIENNTADKGEIIDDIEDLEAIGVIL